MLCDEACRIVSLTVGGTLSGDTIKGPKGQGNAGISNLSGKRTEYSFELGFFKVCQRRRTFIFLHY